MFRALLPMNQDCSSKISVLRFQANFCRLGDLKEIMSLEGKCCWGKLCRIVEQLECVICQKPAPPTPHSPPPIERFRPLPTQTGQQWLDKRQLGSFPVSQVARCKCTLLAGNSPISLAGSVEQIRFSQQSPKMLKMASESIKHALVVVFRSFSQRFPLGAPVCCSTNRVVAGGETLMQKVRKSRVWRNSCVILCSQFSRNKQQPS